MKQFQASSDSALEYAKQASRLAHGRSEEGRVIWLVANAQASQKDWAEAYEAFEQAFEKLLAVSAIDAALVVCDHVRSLLESGQVGEARSRTQTMRTLLEPLAYNPIASAAIRDLLQCEYEGQQLTLPFLLTIKKRIEAGRRVDTRRPK